MHNEIACVYLTIYGGNKLPPFYIGSAWKKNLDKGYRGSVNSIKYKEIWRAEIKTNPQLFTTKIISTLASREEAYKRENEIQRKLNVDTNDLYINQYIQGVTHTKETRNKISRTNTGRVKPMESRIKHSKTATGAKKPWLYKPVAQYDLSGKLVQTFENVTVAANCLNTSTSNILS